MGLFKGKYGTYTLPERLTQVETRERRLIGSLVSAYKEQVKGARSEQQKASAKARLYEALRERDRVLAARAKPEPLSQGKKRSILI